MELFNLEKNSKEYNYNLKNNNFQHKNFMMIRAINFSLISSFNNKIIGINRLNNIINNHLFKIRICVYVNLLSYYYDMKDNDNYINIRKLLSNIALKKLINKKYYSLKYYFYKFHSRVFSQNHLTISNENLYN